MITEFKHQLIEFWTNCVESRCHDILKALYDDNLFKIFILLNISHNFFFYCSSSSESKFPEIVLLILPKSIILLYFMYITSWIFDEVYVIQSKGDEIKIKITQNNKNS